MHPWHGVYIDEDQLAETFPVVMEVPTGNKYELDKESGPAVSGADPLPRR